MIINRSNFLKHSLKHLPSDLDLFVIHPGEFYCSSKPLIIQTLLGSCVSACLYDRENSVAGMNHFLLAAPRYPKAHPPLLLCEAGRYGINSMELLINDMMKKGAIRSQIRAKVFGGAAVLDFDEKDDFFKISDINQKFIIEFLKTEKIFLDAVDLGGNRGRIIYFNTKNMDVILRYIHSHKTKAVERDERKYWQEKISHPEESQLFLF